jgi:hypothetical protein
VLVDKEDILGHVTNKAIHIRLLFRRVILEENTNDRFVLSRNDSNRIVFYGMVQSNGI